EMAVHKRSGRTPGAKRVTERAQEHVRRPQPPVEARMSPSTLALSERILARLMPPAQAEALLGDLLEERRLRLQAGSHVSVAGWYWRQLASSVPALLWASVRRGAWLITVITAVASYIAATGIQRVLQSALLPMTTSKS